MSCDEKIVNNGRDEKAQRKQYPDYITYLKNREADKFFNQAMIAEVARADAEVMGNDASAAKYATTKNENLKNAIHLNPYDVEAKRQYQGVGCPKGISDLEGGGVCSIKGIKID